LEINFKSVVIRKLKEIFVIFLLYVFIFSPPLIFLHFGLDKLIFGISIVFISYHKLWKNIYYRFQFELIILSLIFFLSFLVTIILNGDKILLGYDFLLMVELIPSSYFLSYLIKLNDKNNSEKILMRTSYIASLVTFYLVLNPIQAYYIKTEVLKFPEELLENFYYRGYGFSDGMFFSYPVIQGFILSFICSGLIRGKGVYIATLLLIISIITNARSGFVPVLIGVILGIFFNPRWTFKYLALMILSFSFIFSSLSFLIVKTDILGTSMEWGATSFEIIDDLLKGEKTENVDVLFTDMMIFPKSIIEWLTGSGMYIFGNSTRQSTDIGYLLRLNYGGIFYLTLFIILSSYMARKLFKINKVLSLLMFLSLIYLNFKADFFVVNPASRFFFLIYVMAVLDPSLFRIKKEKISLNG
jgi:hypothetical protein